MQHGGGWMHAGARVRGEGGPMAAGGGRRWGRRSVGRRPEGLQKNPPKKNRPTCLIAMPVELPLMPVPVSSMS